MSSASQGECGSSARCCTRALVFCLAQKRRRVQEHLDEADLRVTFKVSSAPVSSCSGGRCERASIGKTFLVFAKGGCRKSASKLCSKPTSHFKVHRDLPTVSHDHGGM